jgi:F-type H+-transporting ATPase subunit b
MNLFKLDPGLAIWTWISFGILFFILKKFALPKIMNTINAREAKIAESVDNAEKIEQRLQEIEQEHKEILKHTNAEANEILKKTRTDAEMLRQKLLEKAEDEARSIIEQANIKILEDRETMIKAMGADIADFVCDTSETIIGRSFTTASDRDWALEQANNL